MLYLDNQKSTINNGYSYFLSGSSLDEAKELLGDFPYTDLGGEIEFSPLKLGIVCDLLVDFEITSHRKDIIKRIEKVKAPKLTLVDAPQFPTFKLQPHQYQMDAVKYGLDHPRFLLGDEMGLGKTGTMIFLSEILKALYGFKHVLVICGVNGAKFNWHQIEIPKFSYEKSHIVGGRVNRNNNFVIDDIPKRVKDLQQPHEEFYLIINVESLRDEKITNQLQKMITNGDIGMVIFDEIHVASGRSSTQGKAIHKLKPKYRVGLTGTPIYNKPLDIYNIISWLGYEHKNFDDFRSEYCYEIPKTIARDNRIIKFSEYIYKDLSMLHEKLKQFMLRRTVDVLQLPEPIFKDEYVELRKAQLKVYNDIKEEIKNSNDYASLLSVERIITNPGVGFIKARQAVSCPSKFGIKEDAKLERTTEIVEELLDSNKSVVIFAWFNETINSYTRHLTNKFKDVIISIDENTSNAQDKVTEFQTSTTPKVLIGTIGKLGTSFTATKADVVIFVDKHVVWAQYRQAYMRVWRQGQTKNVVIVNLLAKDTVDERMEYLIARGRSHSLQVVDGIQDDTYLESKYTLDDLL